MRFMRHTRRLAHARTRKVPRSLSLSAVRVLHVLKHSLCLACALLITRSRFRDILTHLRASGSRYQYAGDSRNFRETWDVCIVCVCVCVYILRGWRLYPRALQMIRGSGNKKVHSDYLRVDKINH